MMTESRRRSQAHFDWPLLLAVYALALFGLYCITAATYEPDISENAPLLNKILNTRSGLWQSIFIMVSPIIIAVVMAIPTEFIRARTELAYYGIFSLLLFTLVAGVTVSNLRGWLNAGSRNIQPSEFAKLSILLMLAKHLSMTEKPMSKFKDFMRIMMIVGVPAVAILAQGETGTVLVIAFIFLVMIYFAGVDLRLLLGMLAVAAVAVGILLAYGLMAEEPNYRIVRILGFLDPQKYAQDASYQLLKSQRTIGAGQIYGVGPFVSGSSTTLQYVPESSTDFIFTVIGECFGFVGCSAVLLLYLFIVLRMLYLARFTYDKFSRLVIIGVMALFFFHLFQNVAMCLGLMPITGIPLPFLSYGGSNFISNIAAISLVLNVTRSRSAAPMLTMPLPKMKMNKK